MLLVAGSYKSAFKLAVLPFLLGDVIKIALGAAVLPTGWALLKKK